MTLWLARHAKPLVAPGICYGALDIAADAELTLAAAQALARDLPRGSVVKVSPLRRCQQLAQALQTLRQDLGLGTDARLREMDFGHWEGVAWADIPRAAVDAWTDDFAHHRFGGKESANEVLARVASAWDERQPARCTLWITHAGIHQAVLLLQNGVRHMERAADWPMAKLGYGEWGVFA
jgi:alpha-ribazole phosphatase